MSMLERLEDFLSERFSEKELRRLIGAYAPTLEPTLPAGSASPAEVVNAAVAALDRNGLVLDALFERLRLLRPTLRDEVRQLAAVFTLLAGRPALQVVAPLLVPGDRDEDIPILAGLLRADGLAEDDALELAELLLEAFPGPIARADAVGLTIAPDLLDPYAAGVALRWPPLSVDIRLQPGLSPPITAGAPALLSARPGQVVHASIRCRVDIDVTVINVTHRQGEAPVRCRLPAIAADPGRWAAQLAMDETWGVEQFLFHVRPRLRELGARIAPAGAVMVDPRQCFAQEQARVLGELGPGWLVELLVDHLPATRSLA